MGAGLLATGGLLPALGIGVGGSLLASELNKPSKASRDSQAARKPSLPMRPKPLMPSRTHHRWISCIPFAIRLPPKSARFGQGSP